MLCRDGENIVTTVYRKVTNADVYLNWNLFCPHSWKRGTLKTLTQRAYMICSTTEFLDTELKHLEEVFVEKNNYPKWVFRQIFTQVEFIHDSNLSPPTIETIEVPTNENETLTKKHMLLLPYQGDKGIRLTKSLKIDLNKDLPNNVKTQVTFTLKNLALNLMLRTGPNLNAKHDVIYFGKFQNRIVLIIILVNLLGEFLSEL